MTQPESSAALQKIGRNLVNFQKLEGMLKYLASAPNYSGSLEDIQSQKEKQISSLHLKSFGLVAKEFFEFVYPENRRDSKDTDGGIYQVAVTITGGDRERLVAAIRSLVDARNDLVHHRLTVFDHGSAQDCKELISFLDEQNERLIPVYEEVAELTKTMRLARREMANVVEPEM